MEIAASGLRANAIRVAVSANNVANINTESFRDSQVATTDRAYIGGVGQGTRVAATYQAPIMGGGGAAAAGALPGTEARPSTTDPVREMTGQMAAQKAYGANAAAFRVADDMTQTLVDLRR